MTGRMTARGRGRGVRLGVLVPVVAAVGLFGGPGADAAPRGPGRDVPDMAVIIAGGSGRTATVRSGEPGFDRLWALLQPTYTGTERVPEDWAEGRYPPVRLTVLWGLTGVGGWPQTGSAPGGDVAMERQDQLFLAGDGTPWVRTDPAPDVPDDDIRWHRASRSVFDQVKRAGLPAGDGDGDAGRAAGGRAGWWAADDARPAVAGLAVGVLAGVGGTFLIRRAAARPGAGPPREEPRQELIDL
ncbi:hypothetical protein ACFYRY_15385 [Streptomyces sp. NPDC005263]|uniref:hypothetical protein n=1 Tax=Streptomyces sp. NPDC005263 TaxID=3364711 RepID=UPI0036CCCB6C